MTDNPTGKFQPGQPKIPGSGRQRGTPNRLSAALRNEITRAGIQLIPEIRGYMTRVARSDNLNSNLRFQEMVKYMFEQGLVATTTRDDDEDNVQEDL